MPDIQLPLDDQKVTEGTTITMRCHVQGKPQPVITWSRDGYPLLAVKRYMFSYDGTLATLTIEEAITGDGGTYMCEAKNASGMASTDCTIDVMGKPLSILKLLAA